MGWVVVIHFVVAAVPAVAGFPVEIGLVTAAVEYLGVAVPEAVELVEIEEVEGPAVAAD